MRPVLLKSIPHSEDLSLDSGNEVDIPTLDGIAFREAATLELIELDDLSANDKTSVTIPNYRAWRASTTPPMPSQVAP